MTALAYQVFMNNNYRLNKWMCFLLASCFCASSALAQDYQRILEWLPKAKTFTLGEKTITQPTFTNAAHAEEFGLLPFYSEEIPLNVAGDISVEVLNPVYSPSGSLDKESISFIKEKC